MGPVMEEQRGYSQHTLDHQISSETLHLVLCDDPQCAGKFVRLFHDKPSFQLIVAAAPTMSRNMCDGNMDNTRNGGVGRNLASSPWTLVDLVPPLLLVHEVS